MNAINSGYLEELFSYSLFIFFKTQKLIKNLFLKMWNN